MNGPILKDTREEVRAMAEDFLSKTGRPTFILGTNAYGAAVAHWLANKGRAVKGFINDGLADQRYKDIPVVRMEDVPEGAALVNCIVEGRAVQARDNLHARRPAAYTDYFALQAIVPDALLEVQFMSNTHTIEQDNRHYKSLYQRLADDLSKQTLEDLLNFRWNRDIRFLEGFPFRLDEQYFEPFVNAGKSPVFIDGGGFDGGTTKEFAALYPDHQEIFYFEPNAASFANSKQQLKEVSNVRFFQKGLWHETATLHFDGSLGSASKLSDSGGTSIDTTSIDHEVKGPVHFIKLDIEGAELNALRGAERTIREHRPILAVCVYHDQQDFWKVPELVLGFHMYSKVYLRHYTQGVFETVMYFV